MTNRLGRPAPGIIGPLVIFEPSAEDFLQRLRRCHASTPLRRPNPRARQNARRGTRAAADVTRDQGSSPVQTGSTGIMASQLAIIPLGDRPFMKMIGIAMTLLFG